MVGAGQTLSASPPEYSCGAVGWVLDGWLRESQPRGFESQRRHLRHLVSEVPASTANWLYCTIPAWNFWVDAHSRSRQAKNCGPRWTMIRSQGGPPLRAKADRARGVRVKAGQDRGLGGLRSGVKAGSSGGPRRRGTTQKQKRGNSVVGAGSDSGCLAAGVLLWRGGLSAGRLTQRIAVTWVQIPVTTPATVIWFLLLPAVCLSWCKSPPDIFMI